MWQNRLLLPLILFVFIISKTNYVVESSILKRPKISVPPEVRIHSGTEFTVQCFGTHQLHWTLPTIPEYYKLWTTVVITELAKNETAEMPFGSQLKISNISFAYTGRYSCRICHLKWHQKRQSVMEKYREFYIFVRSDEFLAASVQTKLFVPFARQIVPCRPTSKDVNVAFVCVENGYTVKLTQDDSSFFSYQKGFEIIKGICRTGMPECHYARYNQFFKQSIVFVHSYDGTKTGLIIEPKGPTLVVEYGQPIQLRCSSESPTTDCLIWDQPKHSLTSSNDRLAFRCSMEERISRKCPRYQTFDLHTCLPKKILHISTADWSHSGLYTCIGITTNFTITISMINVKVVDHKRHFIDIQSENGICSIAHEANRNSSIDLTFDIDSYPTPIVTWFNNENQPIVPSPKAKYDVQPLHNMKGTLRVNRLGIEDSGTYTIHVSNVYLYKTLGIYLDVVSKPQVDLQMDQYPLVNSIFLVQCKTVANPPISTENDIEFYLLPKIHNSLIDPTNSTDRVPPVEALEFKIDNFTTAIFARFKAIDEGRLVCRIQNQFGFDEDSKVLRLTDARHGEAFTILSECEDLKQLDGTTFTMTIYTNDDLHMICAASTYEFFDNLKWRRRSTDQYYDLERKNDVIVYGRHSKWTYRRHFILPRIRLQDSGLFECTGQRQDGVLTKLRIMVNVTIGTEPKLITTNMKMDSMQVDFGGTMSLFCMFTGLPQPKVVWTKDGIELSGNSNSRKFTSTNERLSVFNITHLDSGRYHCRGTNPMGNISLEMNILVSGDLQISGQQFLVALSTMLIISLVLTCGAIYFVKTKIQQFNTSFGR